MLRDSLNSGLMVQRASRLWQNCLLAALAECVSETASWGESATILPNFPA